MKLKTHSLTNIYQHRSRQAVFTGDLIGITGRIGTGKSNLVRSIGANITGEWTGGKKERVITLGEKNGSVETVLAVRPGLDLTITRDLRRNKASLAFSDGRATIEGADSVNASVLQELQVDKSILREVVFVEQDSIAALLFANDSQKDRLASRFFGIERSNALEKDLSTRINAVTLVSFAEPVADIQDRIVTVRQKQDQWTIKLEKIEVPDTEELSRLRLHLSLYLASGKISEARREYVRRRESLCNEIEKLNAEINVFEVSIASIPVQRLREKYIEEAEKARKWDLRQKNEADTARFTAELKRLGEAPRHLQDIETLQREVERISREESVSESAAQIRATIHVSLFEGSPTTCEVCESPIGLAELGRMRQLVEKDGTVRRDQSRLDKLKAALRAAQEDNTRHKQQHYTASCRLQEARQSLEELGIDLGPGDPKHWEQNLATYDEMREELAEAVGKKDNKQKELSLLQEPAGQPPAYPENFDPHIAQERFTALSSQADAVREAQEQLRILSREHELLRESLERARRVEAENVIQGELKAALVRIRAQFHPDGAPKELIGRRLQRMEEKINEYLSLLESDFTVRCSGGFNFECIFSDKPGAILATELSGGQKISLSLAFRLAAVETFSASVGLLVLDEPTVWLDTETRAHFIRVLERLKAMAQQLDMTFIVVTHEESYRDVFDQLIEL